MVWTIQLWTPFNNSLENWFSETDANADLTLTQTLTKELLKWKDEQTGFKERRINKIGQWIKI